jgi:hypothetical protein
MTDTGAARLPGLPTLKTADPALARWAQAVAEHLEVRAGARGNPLERSVTLRELQGLSAKSGAVRVNASSDGLQIDLGDGRSGSVSVAAFANMIRATKLYSDLLKKLDDPTRFDGLRSEVAQILNLSIADVAAELGASINRVESKQQSDSLSLAYRVNEVTAAVAGGAAGVREVVFASSEATKAQAGRITQVQARLNDVGGVTIEESIVATASSITGLEGQLTWKVDAGGAYAAIGLAATSSIAGVNDSAIILRAGKLAFVAEGEVIGTGSGEIDPQNPDLTRIPFGVDANGVYINGQVRVNASGRTLEESAQDGADGTNGTNGDQGIPGADGANGQTFYTWIAYATNSTGTAGFTTGANTGQTYIGLANNKTTATESSTSSDYTWSLIKGSDGVQGTDGIDGTTTYTWFAYANNSTGTSGFTAGAWTNQTYIGLATNKTTATESTDPSDYSWSLIKGSDGANGTNGTNGATGSTGPNGTRGNVTGYATGSSWSDSTANDKLVEITGGYQKVIGDTVTISNGSVYAGTKYWGGSSWVDPGVRIDGNLLVTGSVSSGSLSTTGLTITSGYGASEFGTNDAGRNAVAVFQAYSATYWGMYVKTGWMGCAAQLQVGGAATFASTVTTGGAFSINSGGMYCNGTATFSSTVTFGGKLTINSGGMLCYGNGYFSNQGSVGLEGIGGSSSHGVVGFPGYDFYAYGNGLSGPFTGAHDALVPKDFAGEVGDILVDRGVAAKAGISNTICFVQISDRPGQKGIIGVLATFPQPLTFDYPPAALCVVTDEGRAPAPEFSVFEATHNQIAMNSLGEGQVNVCGESGNLEIGDLIVTSSTPGKGMKQADDLVRSYTVAKCRENVTFDSPEQVKMLACIYLCG